MATPWKIKRRKIKGVLKRVKVRRVNGREQVRVLNYANTTDNSPRIGGHIRKRIRKHHAMKHRKTAVRGKFMLMKGKAKKGSLINLRRTKMHKMKRIRLFHRL